jgi:hypothetical protein
MWILKNPLQHVIKHNMYIGSADKIWVKSGFTVSVTILELWINGFINEKCFLSSRNSSYGNVFI